MIIAISTMRHQRIKAAGNLRRGIGWFKRNAMTVSLRLGSEFKFGFSSGDRSLSSFANVDRRDIEKPIEMAVWRCRSFCPALVKRVSYG
jgi:hypothetical protein